MASQPYITEVLKAINDDITLFDTTYKKSGNGGPLGVLFFHAFVKQGKFLLPDGAPPFRPSVEPLGMNQARFITEINKFKIFCRTDLTASKREIVFVQMCEALHPDEANILIAIKDQKLTELYPNITDVVVANAGFIPQPIVVKATVEVNENVDVEPPVKKKKRYYPKKRIQ